MQVTVLLSACPLAILCPEVVEQSACFPFRACYPPSSCSIAVCPVRAFSELRLALADKATSINLQFFSSEGFAGPVCLWLNSVLKFMLINVSSWKPLLSSKQEWN